MTETDNFEAGTEERPVARQSLLTTYAWPFTAGFVALIGAFAWWQQLKPSNVDRLTAEYSRALGANAADPAPSYVGPIILAVVGGLILLLMVLHAVVRSATRSNLH